MKDTNVTLSLQYILDLRNEIHQEQVRVEKLTDSCERGWALAREYDEKANSLLQTNMELVKETEKNEAEIRRLQLVYLTRTKGEAEADAKIIEHLTDSNQAKERRIFALEEELRQSIELAVIDDLAAANKTIATYEAELKEARTQLTTAGRNVTSYQEENDRLKKQLHDTCDILSTVRQQLQRAGDSNLQYDLDLNRACTLHREATAELGAVQIELDETRALRQAYWNQFQQANTELEEHREQLKKVQERFDDFARRHTSGEC